MSSRQEHQLMYTFRGIDPDLMTNLSFSENQIDSYAAGFDKVAAWVDASLDLYRPELSQILYPLFVYSYLETVKMQQNSMRAKEMMRKVQDRFVLCQGASASVAKELQDLSSVLFPQHLQNPVPRALLESTAVVKLSRVSLELLMNFLQRHSLWGTLSICNQYIHFELTAMLASEVRPPQRLLLKDTDTEGHRVNMQPVQLGRRSGCLEEQLLKRQDAPPPLQIPTAVPESAAASTAKLPAAAGPDAQEAVPSTPAPAGETVAAPTPQPAAATQGDAAADNADGTAAEGAATDPPAGKEKDAAAEKAEAPAPAAKAAPKRKPEETRRRLKAVKAAETEVSKWCSGLVEARLPVKEWPSDLVNTALDQMQSCTELGPHAPPSCCFFTVPGAQQKVTCMTVSSDVSLLAVASMDSCIRVTQVSAAGRQPLSDDPGAACLADPASVCSRLWAHTGPVYRLAFGHTRQHLYSCGLDGTVRLWETDMGANLVVWRGHMVPVWDVAPGPFGHWLASGGADWTMKLWCGERPNCLRSFAGHQGDVDCLTWHPNGNLLFSGSSADRSARLWDARTGGCVRLLASNPGPVSQVAISPDGSTAAVGTHDGALRLWDLGKAEGLALLDGHTSSVLSLAFSRAGQILASGSLDCSLALWQPSSVHESIECGGTLFKDFPALGCTGPVPYSQLSSHLTRSTPVQYLSFTMSNLLLAGGPRWPARRGGGS